MDYSVKKNKGSQYLVILIGVFCAVAFGMVGAVANGWIALLLFAPVIPVVMVLRDFRAGAVLLMALLPLQNSPVLPSFTGFNIINFIVLGTFSSLYLSYFAHKVEFFRISKVFWWAYLVPILLAVAMGLTHLKKVPDVEAYTLWLKPYTYVVGLVIKPLFILLGAWVVSIAALQSKRPQLFLIPLCISAVLPSLLLMAFVLHSGLGLTTLASEHQRGLLSSLGMHANAFGQFFGLSFIILLFLLPAITGRAARFWLLSALGIVSLALTLTFSRGGYVVALVGMLSFLFIQRKLRYAFVLFCFAVVAVLFAPDALVGRVTTGFGTPVANQVTAGKADELTAGRVWIWSQVVPEIVRSPVWGSGVGSIAWSEPARRGILYYIHPHNMFLRILMDMGLLGLLAFGYFMRFLFRQLGHVARQPDTPPQFAALAQGTRMAVIGILVGGMSGGNYIAGPEEAVFWMALGILLPLFPRPKRSTLARHTGNLPAAA